jgi:polyisoprenoid-binding protein YceI
MKKVALLGLSLLFLVSCKNEEKAETSEPTTVEEGINGSFVVDSTSTIAWIGSKPTGKHNGKIVVKNGEFSVENGKIISGKFTIDMNSITVEDIEGDEKAGLEGHLKGTAKPEANNHFFNVSKYPQATFTVTSFMNEGGSDMVEGDLTIKDKTNKVKFPVSISEADGVVTMTSQEFKINRTLWGVNYGSKSIFDDLGDKFIDDEIALQLNVTAKKQ